MTLVPVRSRPAIAFAASSTLPPPMPSTTSIAASRFAATAESTTAGLGSSVTATSPATVTPAARRPSRSASRRPDAARDRPPVTSRTRDPWAATIAGTRANAPAPKVMRGMRPSAKSGTGGTATGHGSAHDAGVSGHRPS